jgi:hypothetical protein
MKEFNEFLIKLFTHMSTGNFTVKVICKDDVLFDADVIGYSEEYMTVKVKFHSDNLTKPGYIRKERTKLWSMEKYDDDYDLVEANIPVKVDDINYKYIVVE